MNPYHISSPRAATDGRLLVCHVIFNLGYGGLENGLVNLINNLPAGRYRHAIICLKRAEAFGERIRHADTEVFSIGKREGKDPGAYLKVWRLLRRLRPDIVHTRNLPTLDMLLPAALSGCRRLVHGEHGFDMVELDGRNRRYNRLRRASRLVVGRYVTVSRDIAGWLEREIGVPADRVSLVYNGVDVERFRPGDGGRAPLPEGFVPPDGFVVGTVGRLEEVKDQTTLARAFVELLRRRPELRRHLRLVIIGDGRLRPEVEGVLRDGGAADLAWLPGFRDDTPEIYRALDLFALPSRREGVSNTLLEAMASGLPLVATRVGGNPEIVVEGETGLLVPAEAPEAMAAALGRYAGDPGAARAAGAAGRRLAETRFSLAAMMEGYHRVYEGLAPRSARIERNRSS